MAKIAFLGMGAMGIRMAQSLLEASHELRVWNRTPDRCSKIAAKGAVIASTPAQAAEGADFVISMLRDDDASREVWLAPNSGALFSIAETAIALECSTISIGWARELAQHFQSAKRRIVEAPVAGSRPQAEAKQLIFMLGGDESLVKTVRPIVEKMGGAVHYAGPAGSAAAAKLTVNALYAVQIATISELIGLLQAGDFDPRPIIDIVTATPACSSAVKMASGLILNHQFAPLFPIELVEKDLRYALTIGQSENAKAPVVSAARQSYHDAVSEGFGDSNITGIAQRFLKDLAHKA